jgi:hypothetical protein
MSQRGTLRAQIARFSLVCTTIPLILACGGLFQADAMAAYNTSDLGGTWYVHSLASNPGAPWWEYGPISVDAGGNFSGTLQEYGSDPDVISGQFLLDADGVLTIAGKPTNPTALGFGHGHMTIDKNIINWVSTWSSGVPGTSEMAIVTRRGASYQTSDLAGTWHLHGLFSGSGYNWMSGLLVIQANGAFSGTVGEHDKPEAVSGQLQIDSTGVITMVGGQPDEHLTMAANKNVIVMISTSGDALSGYRSELLVWTRAAASYQTSDLAGTWYVHALAAGPGAPWWLYGRICVLSDGSWTGTLQESDGNLHANAAGQFQIDTGGVVTFGGSYANPTHGHMSADKNLFVVGETWQTEQPGTANLMVFTRGEMPLYRFYSPSNGRHFYTTNESEMQKLLVPPSSWFWTYEGVAYHPLPNTSEPGSLPVYRFWSNTFSSHFYTIDVQERDKLLAYPAAWFWTYEGPAFCAYPPTLQPADTNAVYRFWSETFGSHFYTMDEQERDKLLAYPAAWFWSYEGIAWFARP